MYLTELMKCSFCCIYLHCTLVVGFTVDHSLPCILHQLAPGVEAWILHPSGCGVRCLALSGDCCVSGLVIITVVSDWLYHNIIICGSNSSWFG